MVSGHHDMQRVRAIVLLLLFLYFPISLFTNATLGQVSWQDTPSPAENTRVS